MSAKPPLRILIGFSPGSASDDLVRLLVPGLSAALGRSVEIELMPGDLGLHAVRATIASPPDGNTLLVATLGTHAINPALNPDLGYDPVSDFTPVCLATRAPLVLGVRTSLGAGDVADLVAIAGDTGLAFGSSGVGSAPYLAGLLFGKHTGAAMRHRAYRETRDLYEDLLAGRLDLSFNNAASMVRYVRSGRLTALGVTTATRCAALPDVPTLAEAGLAGFDMSNWLGFVAPPRTESSIIMEQAQAIRSALQSTRVIDALAETGIEAVGSGGREFEVFLTKELARCRSLI